MLTYNIYGISSFLEIVLGCPLLQNRLGREPSFLTLRQIETLIPACAKLEPPINSQLNCARLDNVLFEYDNSISTQFQCLYIRVR